MAQASGNGAFIMNSLAMLLETGKLHPRSQTMQQLHPSTMCVQASLTRRTEKWITAGNTHLVCSLKAVIGKDIGHKKNNNGCERSNHIWAGGIREAFTI